MVVLSENDRLSWIIVIIRWVMTPVNRDCYEYNTLVTTTREVTGYA